MSDAQAWRSLLAHDTKYQDLSGNSLATRACLDSSGYSGFGGFVLQEINLYLGLSATQFDMPAFRPGTVVCVLCTLIWSLCVMKELRSYWLIVQALFWLPRAPTSEMRDSSLYISCCRVWILIFLYAVRLTITLLLLGGGIRLLGSTTSILQMTLITAALPVILNIDKQFFTSIMPMEVKLDIQQFKPFRVHYSRLHSQIETFIAAFLVFTVLLVSYSQVISGFEQAMLDIKLQMCGGQQAFVVAHNPSSQLTYALRTDGTDDVGVQAVELLMVQAAPNWLMVTTADSFQTESIRSMKEEAELTPCWEEHEELMETNSSQLARTARTAAAVALNYFLNESLVAPSCQELAEKCHDPKARLLRLACGVTCGCSEPRSSPWYKVESQGCSSACLASAVSKAVALPCQDIEKTNETWLSLWDEYIPALSNLLKLSDNETLALLPQVQAMKAQGCPGLQQQVEPITGAKWCDGHPDFFRPFTYLCPSSCGGCR